MKRRGPRPDLAARNIQRATHAMTGTPTFKSWDAMKQRCLNPRSKDYPHYGARGITVCPEWMTFEAFLRDMGVRPEGMTLGRIDNSAGYSAANCRWETPMEQNSNRRSTRTVEALGKVMTVAQWARELGCSRQVIRHRLESGWEPSEAVTRAPNKANRRTQWL